MILLPNKEYSQRLLDELNCIGYRFLESATEYLIDEDDEEYLVIIAAEMLRRSRLRCCGVPRCAATR